MPFVLRQTVLKGYLDSRLANSPELFYTSIVLIYWNPMGKCREIWFRRMWGVVLGSNTGGNSVMVIHAIHFSRVPVVHPPPLSVVWTAERVFHNESWWHTFHWTGLNCPDEHFRVDFRLECVFSNSHTHMVLTLYIYSSWYSYRFVYYLLRIRRKWLLVTISVLSMY